MKKILVTGGAGFIGSNLCHFLIESGYYVVCLDNFSTGHIENIQDLIDEKPDRFKLITGDIRNLNTCKEAVKEVYAVMHEAALGSIPRSFNDPITTTEVNINGFLNMLIAAKDEKIDRFIFAASSSTYGDDKTYPKVEDHIGKPMSPYALTKYVDELYAHIFALAYGLKYIGIRYFNVFGRRQDANSQYSAVIPLFIKDLKLHKSPIINGDGSNSRDFTYIDNILKINDLALNTTSSEALNQIYNGACGESTSLNQLFDLLRSTMSLYDPKIEQIKPIYGSKRLGDILHSKANINKAKMLLGYIPPFSFREGLKETVDWYWNNM